MKHGSDLSLELKDAVIVHQNLPKRVVAIHHHDWHEIILPLAGTIKVSSPNEPPVTARRGEMVFIPAFQEHAYEIKGGDAEQVILLFRPSWVEMTVEKITVLQQSVLIAELCIFLMIDLEVQAKESAERNLAPIILTLKAALERSLTVAKINTPVTELRPKIRDDRLRKAVSFLEEHFSSEDVLERAAKQGAVSSRTLSRLFKTDLGLSPGDVLRLIRIAHAKKLLIAGNYSITEVALDSGYSAMSQFISNFKAATGTLPSQFRKK
jgi:AraC-like DNA-binding protein